MKRFLSALRPAGVGVSFMLFFLLFSYAWQTMPVLSFLKPHPFYFMGIVLLLTIIGVFCIGYWGIKRFRSLSNEERKARILKSKKTIPFALLAAVVLIAIS